ncbi:hypothetical protein Tco_0933083, partial [Tanacetum coccineum]
ETVHKELSESLARAATTASSLEAEQDSGDQEDASKQRRKIDDIDKDAEITLVHETQGRYGDDIMFDVSDLAGKEVFVAEQGVPDSENDDAAQVSTATITATITNVELTLAQTLAELKSTRPKVEGLVIHEMEQATTPIVSSQQPAHVKAQD